MLPQCLISWCPVRSLLLAAVVFVAFAVALGEQCVWSDDETRPGLVAREMVLHGHWLVPYLAGNVYPDKPPLFAWLVALGSPHGVSEWSLRLPAAAAAAATVGVTHAIATQIAGPVAGLMAAAVLAASPAFVHWARMGRMESLLVLWIALTFWSALAWLHTGARRPAALAGLWMGLGLLTKGPLALIPVPAVALASAAHRAARTGSRSHVVIALAAALAVPALWLALSAIVDMNAVVDYGRAVIQAFDKEIVLQRRRPRPLPFRIATVSADFFPWTLLLPGAAVQLVRSWRCAWRPLALPLGWAAAAGVFRTAVISPRTPYYLVLYPALAIVVGWAWSTATGRVRLLLLAPLGIVVLGCMIFGIRVLAAPLSIVVHGVSVPLDAGLGASLVVLSVVAAGAATVFLRAGRMAGVGVVLGAGVLLVVLALETRVYNSAVNQRFPTRSAGGRFTRAAPSDVSVLYIDREREPALAFYMPQRPQQARDMTDLRMRLGGNDASHSVYALLSAADLDALQSVACRPVRIAHEERVDKVTYFLAEFRPDPGCLPTTRR